MSTERQQQIYAAYDAIETAEPSISTERLLAMTADKARCSIYQVIGAIYVVGKERGIVTDG